MLTAEAADRLGRQHPESRTVLLQNLSRSADRIVGRRSGEVAVLARRVATVRGFPARP